jgi:endonuclease YncB( thermonuclease family)
MPMLCIAGTFHVVGTEPDGDSVRFVPDDPATWARVPGVHRVRTNARGGAQLRLDGVDALETHYAPRGGQTVHQPLELAHAAGAELLKWLGFRDVVRQVETVTAARDDDRPGFVLTRTADTYGRCVALVGRGDPPAASGESIYVTVALLRKTANHRLLATGLVYPTFYSKLYVDLRAEMAKQAVAARKAGKGVSADDETQAGVRVAALSTLTDHAVILPKLFRRLVDYLDINDDESSLAGFKAYLAQRDDRLYVISAAQKTGLDTVVAVDGQTVRLTHPPEDLIFDEL